MNAWPVGHGSVRRRHRGDVRRENRRWWWRRLSLAGALVLLVTGALVGDGLLLATGLVASGVALQLLWRGKPPGRREL